MTGVDRLNIHERQNVFGFIDDADRQFASDEFTENAGFPIDTALSQQGLIVVQSHTGHPLG